MTKKNKAKPTIKRVGPGRPRIAEPRTHRLSVQYSDKEWATLDRLADGCPLAAYVRIKSLEP